MRRHYSALRIECLEDRTTPTATVLPFSVAGGNSSWQLKNNITGDGIFGLAQNGFGIDDAKLNTPLVVDAYDDAFLVAVNGTQYKDANGTVDLTGNTVTTDAVALSGLNTWVELYFDPNSATVRALYNFTNSTGSPINAKILWGNNAGSDALTKLQHTSSGDAILDSTDRWLITDDNANGDPVLTWVRFGPGPVQTPSATPQVPGAGNDLYVEEFSLGVPAGTTRRLMFFGQLHVDVAGATAAAATFDSNTAMTSAGLLTGLSNQTQSEIVNWTFGSGQSLNASNVTDVGPGNNINATTVSKYSFSVTYSDLANIDVSTLGNNDIHVTGPNGFDVTATFDSANPPTNATSVTATYSFTPPGSKWNITDNGNYSFELLAGSVKNGVGAGVSQNKLGAISVDMHVPTVTINQSAGQVDPTNVSPINFSVVFSEPVTGFDNADLTIGGTAGATTALVTGSGTTYNVAISGMTKTGTVIPSVKAGGAVDISNDANTASTSTDNSVYFSTGPQSSLTANNVTDIGPGNNIDATSVAKYTFTVTYTDPDIVDTAFLGDNDIRVTGPSGFDVLAHFVSSAPPTDNSTVIATYDFVPPGGKWNITDNGAYTLTLQNDTVRNNLGLGQAQKVLGTVNVDMHVPTVTINQSIGQPDPTGTSPINFTVVFSESVTGFDNTDVAIGGTAGATTALVTGSGSTYNVAISGMTQTGTVTASVKASSAVDISNDASLASTSIDNSVKFSTGPEGSLSANDVTDIGLGNNIDAVTVAKYTFVVSYSDVDNINIATLGDNDIRVTGPNGFDVFAHFVSSDPLVNSTAVDATYEFTPPGGKWDSADDGGYDFTLQANSVQNVLGAGVALTNLGSIGVDMHVPTVTINQAVGQPDPTGVSPIKFTVVFSEIVTGFDASDVIIGSTAGPVSVQVTGVDTTYTVSITGMTLDGTVVADVKAGAALDVSGEASTASKSTDNSVRYSTGPQSSLTASNVTDVGGGNNIDATTVAKYTFTVTYTDLDVVNVTTLDSADIRVTGPSGFDVLATFESATPPTNATSVVATYFFTPPGGKWNITDNGAYTFTLQANSVQNTIGGSVAQANLGTIGVDMHVPTVTINQAVGQADPTGALPINFTVVFSEPVTGFDATDLSLGSTAGAITALVTGTGTTYNVAITGMTQDGTVSASVNAGAAVDVSDDASLASTSTDNSVRFSVGPQSTLTASSVTDVGGGNNINAATVSKYTFTVTYADQDNVNVSTLDNADIRVTGPNGFDVLATFESANPATNATSVVATYFFTPPGGKWNITDNGTYTFTLQANSVENAIGASVAQASLGTVNVNMHVPTVTVNQAAGQADPTGASPINFTVVFSEPVTGFDASDLSLGSTAGAITALVTGTGTTYNVAISGMSLNGTVSASVNAGGAADISDDANLASTSTDNSVRFSVGPQSTLIASNVTDVGGGNNINAATVSKYSFTVTYADQDSVNVSSLNGSDIRVTGPNGFDVFATFESANPATNAISVVATYFFTPPGGKWNVTDNGTYTFTLQANSVENAIGASVAQATLGTVNVNMHVPTVTINKAAGQADPTGASPINFTVVFSEPVTGFDASDLSLGSTAGAITALVTGSGMTYNVAVSGMNQNGTVSASVNAGAAIDISDDASLASTSTDNSVRYSVGPQSTLAASNVTDVGGGNNINAATVAKYTFTVTYADQDNVNVSTLNGNDIRVTGPNGFDVFATFESASPATNSTSVVATYSFTPPGGKWNVTDNGTYTLALQANSVQNAIGAGVAQKSLGTVSADMHVPTVTINQAAGQADPATGSPIHFTVVFSEPVTGFDASDVIIGGTAGATTAFVTGSGTTYNVAVSGMSKNGTVNATVKASAAVDVSNDANTASTSTDNEVTTANTSVALFATGADKGGGPHVKVFNTDGSVRFNFFAYNASFTGGVRVATGDVTGDGVDDIITAPGAGGGPHIRVFNGATGSLQAEWFAYAPTFGNGVFVATGDVNNDGVVDVITGPDAGGGPHVRVFNGTTGKVLREFFAYSAGFPGGVRVASGDVNNDGFDDIIAGAGPGGGPHVIAFSGQNNSVLRSFFAYDAAYGGGVFVAAGDVNNDGKADIITGPNTGAAQVKAFSGADGSVLRSFLAFDTTIGAGLRVGVGVRVASEDVDGDGFDDFIVGDGPHGQPSVRVISGQSLSELHRFFAYDPAFNGGIFVG